MSHLEKLSPAGVAAMAKAGTHAVLLPTTAHLLRLSPPPARALIDAGAPVALASDFNPNAHCWDMPTAMGLACVHFRLSMEEALVAATINGASALGLAHEVGSLEMGKRGDCFLLDAPSWHHLIYQTRPRIEDVFKGGVSVTERGPRLTERGSEAGAAFGVKASGASSLKSLALGIPTAPLPPPAALDPSVPHAPRRPVTVTRTLMRQVAPQQRVRETAAPHTA